ncbi:hypothetical protein PVK06_045790 [Gossypium arboreum]|uniref:Uncharacterized protein n=1 Tax=Gossypium arboreum TaxID=29729 RepID=A0ABR0MV16_GOSAR|nr:hypothetical protein PVK06_045790 [Gossypium arboreum]
MPQMSIGRAGTAPLLHYGISSIPVVDKPSLVRISPLMTSQYLSQRWIRLPARKCCDYYCHLMESHFSADPLEQPFHLGKTSGDGSNAKNKDRKYHLLQELIIT